ncbi:hypothetical protein [Sphingomonas xinjiangensis]|uniref:Alpha/beta hydrolase n=1 Tax=Sphingomonas xinjiangensis TaxID=643568 RepID=A0A840YTR6_9SPHN|nr:hypothetical protein [Sphingomonas xinjiangensis]MBB5713058.1 hypothetical protein [Sphingomonas xinjiangensis]
MDQLLELRRKYFPAAPRPIFVGVVWPSTLLSFDRGPALAGPNLEEAAPESEAATVQALADALATPAERERLYALIDEPRLADQEVVELAGLVAAALGATVQSDLAEGAETGAPDTKAVLAGLDALSVLQPPSSEDEELPEGGISDGTYAALPQNAGVFRYLDPRWALRLASVYQMKDRAGKVGWHGVSALVTDILAASSAPLHAVGHSYGAKVLLSAVAASAASRKVRTMLLLQPAVSHLSFASRVSGRSGSGGYAAVPAKVERSILTTYSGHDRPLHTVFHRALVRAKDLGELQVAAVAATLAGDPPNVYAALGGYGPRDAGETLVQPLVEPGTPFPPAGRHCLVGLDGTIDRQISGHGDVATARMAWLLACQMAD